MEERNKSLLVEKGNVVNMDPEIAAVFKASTKISCKYSLILFILSSVLLLEQNGVGYHMLKVGSKKRRTKAQVQQDKLDELAKENELRTKSARADMLEAEMAAMVQQMEVQKKAAFLMSDMINAKLVHQEDENTIVITNSDGKHRFQYSQQDDQA